MEKYGVAKDLVDELLERRLCDTEEEAREKVASGLAPEMIRKHLKELAKKTKRDINR